MSRPVLTTRDPLLMLEPIAKDQETVLRNLAELYAHDFSEHVAVDLKPSGRFDLPIADVWWTREDHVPYLLRWDGKLAGFALVRRGSRVSSDGDVADMAEFFVIRGLRKKGIGLTAAHALFTAFPGRWEIRVRRTNASALRFWIRVVEQWSGRPREAEPFTAAGVEWDLLRIG